VLQSDGVESDGNFTKVAIVTDPQVSSSNDFRFLLCVVLMEFDHLIMCLLLLFLCSSWIRHRFVCRQRHLLWSLLSFILI